LKILLVTSRVPYPLEKGDKLRAYHFIRELSRHHDLYLFSLATEPLHPRALPELQRFCKEVRIHPLTLFTRAMNVCKAFLRGKPLQVGLFFHSRAKKEVDNWCRNLQPEVFLCQLVRTAEYRPTNSSALCVIDYMDAFSTGMQRRQNNEKWPFSLLFRYEQRQLARYEQASMHWFHLHLIISEQDRSLMPASMQPHLQVVRNGVDLAYYRPEEGIDYSRRNPEILFSGNMSYPPNVQASVFLTEKILPLLLQTHPNALLTLAGAKPAPAVKNCAGKQVRVTGWVNDLREEYGRARVFVAPMMSGTGMQNKLLEAMAMAVPCVTSSMAAAAIDATHRENVLVANSEEEFAEAIRYLLDHANEALRLGKAGREHVEKKFSWQSNIRHFEELISHESQRTS